MLSWLGQRQRNRTGTAIATYDALARVTSAGMFLVDFLVLRRHRPVLSNEISTLVSGLYKLSLGFQLAYLPERYCGAAQSPLPGVAGFHAYLEANELLIGEAEVCAGSPAMIMQAYEAITGGGAVAAADLPPCCASLDIDWEVFDIFADKTAAFWHEAILFVLRTPAFVPVLSAPGLAPDLRDRLNLCLSRRAGELLAGQAGLVVETARAVRLHSGLPVAAWRVDTTTLPRAPEPSALAARMLAWLEGAAPGAMAAAAPEVAGELEAQLGAYDRYEAAALATLEHHLVAIMRTLGYGDMPAALMPSVLSRLCGQTLRDWGAQLA
jgi:hypothetical protein